MLGLGVAVAVGVMAGAARLGGALLLALGKDVGALAVAPAEARGDEVGQAARLEEGVLLDLAVAVEGLAELLHLLEADADDGGLGEGEG